METWLNDRNPEALRFAQLLWYRPTTVLSAHCTHPKLQSLLARWHSREQCVRVKNTPVTLPFVSYAEPRPSGAVSHCGGSNMGATQGGGGAFDGARASTCTAVQLMNSSTPLYAFSPPVTVTREPSVIPSRRAHELCQRPTEVPSAQVRQPWAQTLLTLMHTLRGAWTQVSKLE
jgi:hypothetical protein